MLRNTSANASPEDGSVRKLYVLRLVPSLDTNIFKHLMAKNMNSMAQIADIHLYLLATIRISPISLSLSLSLSLSPPISLFHYLSLPLFLSISPYLYLPLTLFTLIYSPLISLIYSYIAPTPTSSSLLNRTVEVPERKHKG